MTMIEGHRVIEPPQGIPVWDIDPYSETILAEPDSYYSELRRKGPFVYIPKYSILTCGRYKETKEVFSDNERFVSSRGVGLVDFKLADPWRPASIILEVDPPEHTRVRRIMAKCLSPNIMRAQAEMMQTIADDMVAEVVEKGEIEVVTDLAERYPTTIFPIMVGLKNSRARALLDYGAMVFDAVGPDNNIRRSALSVQSTVVPWITEQCQRDNLESNGVGASIYAHADSGDISEEEASLLVRSLLSAGVDTTVTGIASLLFCLAENPDQYEILKQKPQLARQSFEEVLRYLAPVHSFCRTADIDTEVSGVKIQKDTKILCNLASANLDEEQWPHANVFDITRDLHGHLGMGLGSMPVLG